MPQWGIFKKLNLTKTEDRLKAIILVSGIVLTVVLGIAGAVKITMSPDFCKQCHVMAPEYATWESSSHVQIACTKCHIKPGLGNLILHKLSATKELYLYFTGTYDRPIAMNHKLEDEVCTQCHSTNREITPAGDLIIPHDKHAAKKVQCVECHAGVAHGNIAARKMTEDGNYQVWTQEYGQMQMVKDNTEPRMNTCLACHIKRGVTQQCQACHTTISMPPDHKAKDWGTTHGLKARADLDYCDKCHSYSVDAKDVSNSDKVARYARGNVFCYNCHQNRPPGHTDDWRIVHKKDVRNGDVSGCLICHNDQKPTPQDKAVPTYCAKCHGQQSSGQQAGGSNQVTSPDAQKNKFKKIGDVHPPNWRKIHPSIVKNQGATNSGCWDCHDTTHCSRCHLNKL